MTTHSILESSLAARILVEGCMRFRPYGYKWRHYTACPARHRMNWFYGGDVRLAQQTFLAKDYQALPRRRLRAFVVDTATWLEVCSAWTNGREFVRALLVKPQVPAAVGALALAYGFTHRTIDLAPTEGGGQMEEGLSLNEAQSRFPKYDDGSNFLEDFNYARAASEKGLAQIALERDLLGDSCSWTLLREFMWKRRVDVLAHLLARDGEVLSAKTGGHLGSSLARLAISVRACEENSRGFPRNDAWSVRSFCSLVTYLAEKFPGSFSGLAKDF